MAQRVRDKGPTKELPTVKRSDEVQEIKPAKKKIHVFPFRGHISCRSHPREEEVNPLKGATWTGFQASTKILQPL